MSQKKVKPISQKENLFPTGIFGNAKNNNERKRVLDKVKQELEEKKNYYPELTIYERTELGKQLIEASKNDDTNEVKQLIEKGADVNVYSEEEDTALIWAIDNSNHSIIDLLINNGADLNLQDSDGLSPLMFACESRDIRIIKKLIKNGANLNCQNNQGYTPLSLSVHENNTEISRMLIEADADVNLKDNYFRTPLMWSVCREERIEISQLLIENGADLNVKDSLRDTPLHLSIEYSNTKTTGLLIKSGAKLPFNCLHKIDLINLCIYGIEKIKRLFS